MPYRETIVSAAEMAAPKNLPRGSVIGITASRQVTVRLLVRPLPEGVTQLLEKNVGILRRLYSRRKAEAEGEHRNKDLSDGEREEDEDHELLADGADLLSTVEFKENLASRFAEEKGQSDTWRGVVEKIAAFGPRRVGPNILIDNTVQGTCQKLYAFEQSILTMLIMV